MLSRLSLLVAVHVLFACAAWAQCPTGTTAILSDRDNTLIEDAAGALSNGAGLYFFTGRTGQGSDDIRRGLILFDVAGALSPGLTITQASLRLILDQPRDNGAHPVSLHVVQADWGEGGSQGAMGEGGGAAADTGDATWLNSFFGTTTWTSAGGDFVAGASATTTVNSGVNGIYSWASEDMVDDVQSWLDTPLGNFGWLVLSNEASPNTAMRFTTHENTGNEPVLCVKTCGGATPCTIFSDGFESGNTSQWSSTSP
ncbi:MAG: DNRLRE domain-containing protein [Thermoanaerobaculia bacterium]|nr:DNRLRE domain-containing protein [Thermoanaerobaculia bacterium]